MSQEKLQTMVMQNFGGLKRCIMGFVQVENAQGWGRRKRANALPPGSSPSNTSAVFFINQ